MICALLKNSSVSDRVLGMIVSHGLTNPEKPHCTLKACKNDSDIWKKLISAPQQTRTTIMVK